jgi:hypothetical protein
VQHVLHNPDAVIDIDRLATRDLLPAEGEQVLEQVLGQVRRPPRCGKDLVQKTTRPVTSVFMVWSPDMLLCSRICRGVRALRHDAEGWR